MKKCPVSPRAKRSISTLILIVALCVLWCQIRYLNDTTYAYTFSLGNGWGFVIYTKNFEGLSAQLKESVILHESVHLREGTFRFWKRAEQEISAYEEELQDLAAKIKAKKAHYRLTRNPELRDEISELEAFKQELEAGMRQYKR